MRDDIRTVAGQVSVSRQLLDDNPVNFEQIIIHDLLNPPTPEERAEARAKAEADFDAKTAQGLVGIRDDSDYGYTDWTKSKRGERVDKWIPWSLWIRYRTVTRSVQAVVDEIEAVE